MNILCAIIDHHAAELSLGIYEHFEAALFYDRNIQYELPETWVLLGHVWNNDPGRLLMRAFRTAQMYLRREEDPFEKIRQYRFIRNAIKKATEFPNMPVAAREGFLELIAHPIIPA